MDRGAWRAIVHGVAKSQTLSFFFPLPKEREAGSRGPESQDTRKQGLRSSGGKAATKSWQDQCAAEKIGVRSLPTTLCHPQLHP